jgi:hypothetical protein
MGRSKSIGGLGFWDLIMFNKALHAKQGWRLMQNRDSLIVKVLWAKYFPHVSFLSSVVGTRPSFIWRVGDGKSIHIWNDWWLPTPSSFMV